MKIVFDEKHYENVEIGCFNFSNEFEMPHFCTRCNSFQSHFENIFNAFKMKINTNKWFIERIIMSFVDKHGIPFRNDGYDIKLKRYNNKRITMILHEYPFKKGYNKFQMALTDMAYGIDMHDLRIGSRLFIPIDDDYDFFSEWNIWEEIDEDDDWEYVPAVKKYSTQVSNDYWGRSCYEAYNKEIEEQERCLVALGCSKWVVKWRIAPKLPFRKIVDVTVYAKKFFQTVYGDKQDKRVPCYRIMARYNKDSFHHNVGTLDEDDITGKFIFDREFGKFLGRDECTYDSFAEAMEQVKDMYFDHLRSDKGYENIMFFRSIKVIKRPLIKKDEKWDKAREDRKRKPAPMILNKFINEALVLLDKDAPAIDEVKERLKMALKQKIN